MEHNEHTQSIRDSILGKIKARQLRMHPRYYFMLRVAALAAVSLAILVISVFIFNFLFFSIRINSQDAFLSFGPRGWGAFLYFFPWYLFAADVVLVFFLLWLLRQFKFGYKSPALYMLLCVVAVTVAAGFAIDRTTGINDNLLRDADNHSLPGPMNDFYRGARRMPPPGQGVCRCSIVSIDGDTLVVVDERATSSPFSVLLPLDDPRATTSGLAPGDSVFIAGQQGDGGRIDAFGIHLLEPAQ